MTREQAEVEVHPLEQHQTEDDYISLLERASPTIPPPDPMAGRMPDSDGWSQISRLGGWGSTLCQFPMMEECPLQQEEAFTLAWEEVLKRLEEAVTEEQKNQALMWIMFLPQALLRNPTRGGRAGRGQVSKRFHCLQRKDWGALVELQQDDLKKLTAWRENEPVRKN